MGGECCVENTERDYKKFTFQEVRGKTLSSLMKDDKLSRVVEEKRLSGDFNPDLVSRGTMIEARNLEGQSITYLGEKFTPQKIDGEGSMLSNWGLTVGKFRNAMPVQGVTYLRNDLGEYRGTYNSMKPERGVYKNGKGLVYEGTFMNLKKEGDGTETNGVYEFRGKYKNGEMQYGRYWFDRNKPDVYYEGRFVKGQVDGNSGKIYSNGTEITQFRLDEKGEVVYGRVDYSNKDYYIGAFQHGLRHGRGEYHVEGAETYHGEFQGNLRHGKGLLKMDGKEFDITYEKDQVVDLELRPQ